MIDLNEKVSAAEVIVQQVSSYSRALGHPVQPNPKARIVNVVLADHGVDGGVNLDACHFSACKQSPNVDVVDDVARDGAEGRPQTADDSRLLAMGDVIVPHDVMADVFPGPAVLQGALDRFDVALGGVLRGVVPLVAIFAEGDPHTGGVAYIVFLDDPSLAPVGAD